MPGLCTRTISRGSERTMSDMGVSWDQYMRLVGQVGHLKGAIEAHRIITETDLRRGHEERVQDGILYRLAAEVDE